MRLDLLVLIIRLDYFSRKKKFSKKSKIIQTNPLTFKIQNNIN